MTLSPSLATPIRLDGSIQPMLLVVVDTEEEFDWSAPFSRKARSTLNMREQHRAQTILDRHGSKPLYVIDHPVASDDWAVAWLKETVADGRCEVGAHLHSWVNPPYDELISSANSYGCNLDPALERRKIEMLTEQITRGMGHLPVHFRSGRYGVGFKTLRTIRDLGYRCDLSIAPHSNFGSDGGPSFYGWSNDPYWHGSPGGLLGLPVTTGFSGVAKGLGPIGAPILDNFLARTLRLPGALAGLGLLERCRMTIEDVPAAALRRVMRALIADGQRVLTLSYHSSTLLPGANGYARTEMERQQILACLDETLAYFTGALGGRLVGVSEAERVIREQETSGFSKP